jgi:hypothetical protein
MDSNGVKAVRPVPPQLDQEIWAGVNPKWQDVAFLLRDGDRADEGCLTTSACLRVTVDLRMVRHRRRVLGDEINDCDGCEVVISDLSRIEAREFVDRHLCGPPCLDCLDHWPCLPLTSAIRALMNFYRE